MIPAGWLIAFDRTGGVMTVEHKRLSGIRLTLAAVALVAVAPAAHAFTMDTIANSNGGSQYMDPGQQLEDAASGKSAAGQQHSFGDLRFGAGSVGGLGYSGRSPVGAPLDQRFMDR
jgi:hypothetical protein